MKVDSETTPKSSAFVTANFHLVGSDVRASAARVIRAHQPRALPGWLKHDMTSHDHTPRMLAAAFDSLIATPRTVHPPPPIDWAATDRNPTSKTIRGGNPVPPSSAALTGVTHDVGGRNCHDPGDANVANDLTHASCVISSAVYLNTLEAAGGMLVQGWIAMTHGSLFTSSASGVRDHRVAEAGWDVGKDVKVSTGDDVLCTNM